MLVAAVVLSLVFQAPDTKPAAATSNAPAPIQIPSEAWDKLMSRYAQANVLEARIVLKSFLPDKELKQKRLVQTTIVNISAAQKNYGQIQMRSKFSMHQDGHWVDHESSVGLIGDGNNVYFFDGLAKNIWETGKSWQEQVGSLPDLQTIKAWADIETLDSEKIRWATDLTRGRWRGLSFDKPYYRHVYWLDHQQKLRMSEMIPIGLAADSLPHLIVEYVWTDLKQVESATLKSYSAKLPKEYQLLETPGTPISRALKPAPNPKTTPPKE